MRTHARVRAAVHAASASALGGAQRVYARRLAVAGWTLAALVTAAYVVTVILLSPLPLQDLPTHLARAVVMDDLIFHGGARFGGVYQYHPLPIPYVLGDLLLAGGVELVGPRFAGALWCVFALLSLPCAVLFYLRINHLGVGRGPVLALVSLYLATDWFFAMGFLSFRIAVAMTLATLALVDALRRRWSIALFVAYIGAVILDYLMHLSAAVFLVAAVSVSALFRMRWGSARRTEFLLVLPLAALLLWNFAVADSYRQSSDLVEGYYVWGTLHSKFIRVTTEFFRYRRHTDEVMLGAVILCLAVQLGRPRLAQFANKKTVELLAIAATFLALYFVLPRMYADATYVDVRALPLAAIFLIFACVPASGTPVSGPRMGFALAVAVVLAVGNLVSFSRVVVGTNAFVARYRAVVAAIPRRARVLPVSTALGFEGAVWPTLHVSSFITIDRDGVIPYEFTGDNGNVVRYFRYLRRPYDPPERWYIVNPPFNPVWESIACDYSYLIVTRPFSPARLGVATRAVAQNEAAELLAIDRQICPAGMRADAAG